MPENDEVAVASRLEPITVHFATNRDRVDDDRLFGSGFNQAALYVTGSIEVDPVTLVPNRKSLKVDGPPKARDGSMLTLPEAASGGGEASSREAVFVHERIRAEERTGRRADNAAALFIHGFNNTFIDSVRSAADIVLKYGLKAVFCFSWPSYGALARYFGDQDHAERSAAAIALWFSKMLGHLNEAGRHPLLHVVIHSMGARAMSSAIQVIDVAAPAILTKLYFEHVLLAAADEDYDGFVEERRLKKLPALSNWVDIYTNGGDQPLTWSGQLNAHARLGLFGPDRYFAKMPDKTIWIDCTAVGTDGEGGLIKMGHHYYRLSAPVVADIRQVLSGKLPTQVPGRVPDHQFPSRKFSIPSPKGREGEA